jgi:antitoxin YefM
MEHVKDERPATTPEEFLERLRSRAPVDLTESVAEALEAEREARAETLYLLAIQGLRESIQEGMNTPIEECSEELDW